MPSGPRKRPPPKQKQGPPPITAPAGGCRKPRDCVAPLRFPLRVFEGVQDGVFRETTIGGGCRNPGIASLRSAFPCGSSRVCKTEFSGKRNRLYFNYFAFKISNR